jgi:hypothetical protein
VWGVRVGMVPAWPLFLRWTWMHDATTANDEFLSLPDFLKATPSTEGERRLLYLEASNEARDMQGEVVLAKALAASADYFEKFGNVDVQHRSMIGLANGDPNYHLHEIGRPDTVRVDGTRTFVKAEIYQGDTPVAATANNFWDSITKLRPPTRWFASVGGKVQESGRDIDPDTGESRRVIKSVLWCNIGVSRTPVNHKVKQVSVVPFGVFAKCWGAGGLDLTKALTAGYGTDSTTLTGGAALRKQSLDKRPQTYWDIRDLLAKDIMDQRTAADAAAMSDHLSKTYDIRPSEAGEHVKRFLSDLNRGTRHG